MILITSDSPHKPWGQDFHFDKDLLFIDIFQRRVWFKRTDSCIKSCLYITGHMAFSMKHATNGSLLWYQGSQTDTFACNVKAFFPSQTLACHIQSSKSVFTQEHGTTGT